jgi:hypothetical protein
VRLRHLLHRLIYASPAGITGVLEYFNAGRVNKMSLQTLTNKVNFNSTSHTTTTDEFEQAIDLINCNYEVAEYFARKCNSIVFRLPDIEIGDMALLDGFMDIMKEIGEISMEFQAAMSDGRINQNEMNRIAKEISDAQSKLLAWQARVNQVVQ